MVHKINIENKWRVILLMLGLVAVLEGMFSVKVFASLLELRSFEKRHLDALSAPAVRSMVEARLTALDLEIKSLRGRRLLVGSHVAFIEYSEGLCNEYSLQMISLPLEEKNQLQDYKVAGICFSIEGNFHNILRFIHRMEQIDHVASVEGLTITAVNRGKGENDKDLVLAKVIVNRLLQNEYDL